MRTTVDLPDDLHRAAVSLARDRGQSLSATVSDLIRQALVPSPAGRIVDADPVSGVPVIWIGHPVTTEMVRAAADE